MRGQWTEASTLTGRWMFLENYMAGGLVWRNNLSASIKGRTSRAVPSGSIRRRSIPRYSVIILWGCKVWYHAAIIQIDSRLILYGWLWSVCPHIGVIDDKERLDRLTVSLHWLQLLQTAIDGCPVDVFFHLINYTSTIMVQLLMLFHTGVLQLTVWASKMVCVLIGRLKFWLDYLWTGGRD